MKPAPRPAHAAAPAFGDRRDVRAAAMLAADAPGLHVYYVDDHFVPYEGAKPVPKGWNTKRRHAQPGRAGTMVTTTRAGRCASPTASRSGFPPPCPALWPSCGRCSASR
jgi:hypothetical protein